MVYGVIVAVFTILEAMSRYMVLSNVVNPNLVRGCGGRDGKRERRDVYMSKSNCIYLGFVSAGDRNVGIKPKIPWKRLVWV